MIFPDLLEVVSWNFEWSLLLKRKLLRKIDNNSIDSNYKLVNQGKKLKHFSVSMRFQNYTVTTYCLLRKFEIRSTYFTFKTLRTSANWSHACPGHVQPARGLLCKTRFETEWLTLNPIHVQPTFRWSCLDCAVLATQFLWVVGCR